MRDETLSEIGINSGGCVFVRPSVSDFQHIYRAAMEVHWDVANRWLSHPAPRSWTSVQWYRQILAAVTDEYGVRLYPDADTVLTNLPDDLHAEIEASRE